ncbi:MAG: co-chaperone GroES [Candidatus Limnocylindria bacterium]
MPAAVAEKLKLKPLGARVVIKPLEREEMTKSGIVLPDTAREKPQEGRIVAVGPGGYDKNGNKVEMTLKVGDRVLYQKYAGTEFKLDDDEYLVLAHDDVLGLVASD